MQVNIQSSHRILWDVLSKRKIKFTESNVPPKNQVTLPSKTACAMPIPIVTLVHRPRSSHGVQALPQVSSNETELTSETEGQGEGQFKKKYMAYIGQYEGISRKQLVGYSPKGTHIFPLISVTWNLQHLFINGSFNRMIPNLYIGNDGCFTISIHLKLVVSGSRYIGLKSCWKANYPPWN